MNVTLRQPGMNRDDFFDWAEAQDQRYEFDGFAPVAMTAGSLGHNKIVINIFTALRSRLRGGKCQALGPDSGIATVGEIVRYPDVLVTCSQFLDTDRLVPNPVVVFEVLSSSSVRIDRFEKPLEYREVASIRRYIIVESAMIGVSIFARSGPGDDWIAKASLASGKLGLPKLRCNCLSLRFTKAPIY